MQFVCIVVRRIGVSFVVYNMISLFLFRVVFTKIIISSSINVKREILLKLVCKYFLFT